MIVNTATTGCNRTVQISAMEPSISHKTVRRSRDSDVTTSGKRRRFNCQDQDDDFKLQYRSQCDADENLFENVSSVSATSDHVDSSVMCSVIDDSISDLKDEFVSVTELFRSVNGGLSGDSSESSVICLETEEIESISTSKPNKKTTTPASEAVMVTVNEATSCRKPPPLAGNMLSAADGVCLETEEIESVTSKPNNKKTTAAAVAVAAAVTVNEATPRRKPPPSAGEMPSVAEIEELFSKAEKCEQKRFVEKYNYDIVKDVPIEGRYQWIQLKP